MKSHAQKEKEMSVGTEVLEKSKTLVFADFSGVGVELVRKLKKELRETGSSFTVIKKRLLKIILEKKGIDFDPTQFESHVGTIFIHGELSDTAATIYKFSRELVKEKKNFAVLGAYDISGSIAFTADEFTAIAKLPSRDVLLAQVAQLLTGPIRGFMYVLKQIAEKSKDAETDTSEGDKSKEILSEAVADVSASDEKPSPEVVTSETSEDSKQEIADIKTEDPPSSEVVESEETTVEENK